MTALAAGKSEVKFKEGGYEQQGTTGAALFRSGLTGRDRSNGSFYPWGTARDDLELVGFASRDYDSGDTNARVHEKPKILQGQGGTNGVTVAGVTAATNNGNFVYCSTDNWEEDLTLTPTGTMPVGRVHQWITSTYCYVEIIPTKILTTMEFVSIETLTFDDLTTAGTDQTIALGFSLPAFAEFTGQYVDVTAVFTGGTINACIINVGTAGNDDYLIDSDGDQGGNVYTAVILLNEGDAVYGVQGTKIQSKTAATALNIIFTSTAGNLDTADTGSLTVYIYWRFIQ